MNDSKITMTRLFVDETGKAKFEDIEVATSEVDFAPPAPKVGVSTPYDAKRTLFLVLPPQWYGEPHPAPNRQIMTILQGSLEVTGSDGETRTFKTGDVALVEDISGEGHATRNLEDGETILLVTQL